MADNNKEVSITERVKRRSDVMKSVTKKKLSTSDVTEAVEDGVSRTVRRVAGAVNFASKTGPGKAVANAGRAVAETKTGQTVGKAATTVKDTVVNAGAKTARAGVRAAHAGAEAVNSGVDAVKSGAKAVKSGFGVVDEALPLHEYRSTRRQYRKEDKAREKDAKEKDQERRRTAKLRRDWQYYEKDSAEWQDRIDELCFNIYNEQKSFVQYDTDMSEWLKAANARKKMDERNERYCRNMFDYCISPLQHGVSPESVVDTIGLYVGMSLLSKEFRETVTPEIQRLTLCVHDRLGSLHADYKDREVAKNIRKADAIIRRYGYDPSGLELCDPPRPKVQWAEEYLRDHYDGENAKKHAARMRMKADEIAMTKNHGRIPLNPETAALQQLNFMHTYYEKMRDPGLDSEGIQQLREEYDAATKTLGELMKFDNVDMDEMHRSFRTIVGQLTSVYPEFECEFAELAFGSCVKADGVETVRPSADPDKPDIVYTWRGEYIGKDGKAFTGPFSPRAVMDVDVYRTEIGQFYNELFSKIDTADDMVAVMNSEWNTKARQLFLSMMDKDFDALDARDGFAESRRAERVYGLAFSEAVDTWVDAHADEKDRLNELCTNDYRKEHPGRDADFGEYDVREEGGSSYEESYGSET